MLPPSLIQLANKIWKNFHCDAIIGLPVVKLLWCAALDVDNSRKSETFLLNEPTFFRAELAETVVMLFRSVVQLSNLISRNLYYHANAMQQYRHSNFSDVFCLNQWRSHGGVTTLPIEPKMTSYLLLFLIFILKCSILRH